MANADFWRDLSAQFRSLPDDHGMFRIDWDSIVGTPGINWKPFATPDTLARFEALATRAGFALDPDSENFYFTWLFALKDAGPAPKTNTVYEIVLDNEELPEPYDILQGSISNPCAASAVRCSVFKTQALNKKRGSISHLPNDTRNLLSVDALKRIDRAHIEAEKFIWEGEASIDVKRLDSDGYQAGIERNAARLHKARYVLQVLHVEYSRLKLNDSEYRICINREIESASNSLQLHDSQRRLLETEFFFQNQVETTSTTRPHEPLAEENRDAPITPASFPATDKAKTIGQQIEALRLRAEITQEKLAELLRITTRQVQRHIADDATPQDITLAAYNRVFTQLLGEKVVIEIKS